MRLLDISKDYLFVVLGDCILKVHQCNSNIDVISYVKCKEDGECKIISLTVNEEMKYFFACFSNKLICCWDINSNELLGHAYFKKKATSVQCSSFSNLSLNKTLSNSIIDYQVLLVADKAGDLYVSDLPTMQKQILVTGHTASVITDMKLYESLVITCDRDEKVRICHFPAIENIQSFCLGHESVVSSIDATKINNKVLVLSTGWDHKLLLFDAMSGIMLDNISYKDTHNNTILTSSRNDMRIESCVEVMDLDNEADAPHVDVNINGNEYTSITIDQQQQQLEELDQQQQEEEDVENKQYNELIAGNYPLKVITSSIDTIEIAIVMFKSLSMLKINSIHINEYKFKAELTIALEAIPVDIVINTSTNELIVLLPKPFGLQVFKLLVNTIVSGSITTTTIEIENKTKYYNKSITNMLNIAETKGFDFMIPELSTRNDVENGMMKHTLDKRFNSQENLEYRTKKGHKRSKPMKN